MSILKSFGAVFGLNIFEFIISPISNAIVTKSLSVEQYGVMGYWGAVLSLVSSFSALGLGLYNYKMIPGKDENVQYFFLGRTMFIEFVTVSISSVTTALIFRQELLSYSLLFLFILRSILMLINNELIRFIGYQKRNILKSITALLDARLWIVPLIAVVLLQQKLTVSILFAIQLLCSFVVFIIFFVFLDFKKFIIELRPDKKIFKESLAFGIPLIMVDLGQYLLDMGNRYVLKGLLDYESVGLYNFVAVWINVIFKFSMLFVYIAQPYFSDAFNKKESSTFKSIVQLSAKYFWLISVVSSIGFIMNYDSIVNLLGKADYLITKKTALIMLFYPPFLGFSFILQIVGILYGDTKKLPFLFFTSAIICLFSTYLLVQKTGYNGAAVSSVIGYASLFTGMLICYGDKAAVLKTVFSDLRMFLIPLLFFLLNILLVQFSIPFFIVFISNIIILVLLITARILPNNKDYSILKKMNK